MLLPKRIKKRNKRRSTSAGAAPNKESTYTAPASDTPIKEYVGAVSHSGNASVDELDITPELREALREAGLTTVEAILVLTEYDLEMRSYGIIQQQQLGLISGVRRYLCKNGRKDKFPAED